MKADAVKTTRTRWLDRTVGSGLGLLSLAPVVTVVGLAAYLTVSASPVFRYMGWHFLTSLEWSIGNQYANHAVVVHGVRVMPDASYGALVFIVGTALTSLLALLAAIPVAFLAAAGSGYFVKGPIRHLLAGLVEMMAGIPSVIYGLWGLVVVAPAISHHIGPWLNTLFSPLGFLSGPLGSETNLLVAVMVITLMIVPIIAATIRAVMERIPRDMIESGLALGWTEGETFWRVVWPYARSAVVGGSILGLGRALGETMAVLMVSGDALNVLPQNLYSAIGTMAATIAGQLDSALTDPTHMALHALGALGLVLFVMTVLVNLLARAIVKRASSGVSIVEEGS